MGSLISLFLLEIGTCQKSFLFWGQLVGPAMVSPFLLCQLLVLTLRGWPRWQWQLAWLTLILVSHHQHLEKVHMALAIKWQIAVGSQCGSLLRELASGIRSMQVTVPEVITTVTSTITMAVLYWPPELATAMPQFDLPIVCCHAWLPCSLYWGTDQLQTASPKISGCTNKMGLMCSQSPCWSYYWLT